MDEVPFLSFNILEDDEETFVSSLEQFHKSCFNIKDILSKAVFLKYISVVEQTIKQDLINPSDELVKYFLSRPEIKTGTRITTQIIEKHRAATAETLRKIMGVTIASASVNTETKNDNAPENGVVSYIKQLLPGSECRHTQNRGVSTIYVSKNNADICRIRVSKKHNTFRFDYTDLFSGRMTFAGSIEECVQILTQTAAVNT